MPAKCSPYRQGLFRLSLISLALAAGLAGQARAQARQIDVPAGAMDAALKGLAEQTGEQLLYTPDLVAGRRTAGLAGRFSAEEALRRLIADEALIVTRVAPGVLTIKRRPPPAAAPAPSALDPRAAGGLGLSAQLAPTPAPPTTVEAVRVTGSNIRGAARGASPLIILDAETLLQTGRATLAETLQALPQNYAGESAEGLATTRADRVGTNTTFASGLNLRGLGSDATLVLVNGRRVAGSGSRAEFADVSGIPNTAISRVEVLLDGASAVYGSDAVGGVVNIILRRDFDGAELRLRGGGATRGEPTEDQAGLLLGKTWSGGGALFSFEAYRRTRLDAGRRDFTRTADLRSLGGADRRESLSFPGNILQADPLSGLTVPYYAIPAGQDGAALNPSSFQPATVNLQNQNFGVDILPEQRRQSLYLSAHQAIGPRLEVTGDLRYALREASADTASPTATLTVTRANPFFVSPVGASTHQIQYAFAGLMANPRALALARTLTGAIGAKVDLGRRWAADGYLAYASSIDKQRLNGVLHMLHLNEALGVTADNPNTTFDARIDGYLNPFSGLANAPPGVRQALSAGYTQNRVRNDIYTASLQADGPLWDLPGGPVQLAIGGQARRETYDRGGINFNATANPAPQAGLAADRSVLAAFAEVRAPLRGPADGSLSQGALELTGAVRYERYSDFGETVNPKIGVVYSPASGVRLRATYSQSYRAPALAELRDREIYLPIRRTLGTGRLLTLTLNGGNPDLDPETATTFSAGVDFEPEALGGLRLSATWFRTAFDDRIDRPVLTNSSGVLSDPRLAAFVRRITPASDASDLALIEGLLANPATSTALGVFPAQEYGAIVDARYINTSRLTVQGLDLSGAFSTDLAEGRLTLSATASWLFDYVQKITPTDAPADLVGVLGHPARLRSRLSADFARGVWGVGAALNYRTDQKDPVGARIGDDATIDLNLRLEGPRGSRFADTRLILSVRNLFDADPPFYDNPSGFGFDPATGDPIGRFVALQLTRRW